MTIEITGKPAPSIPASHADTVHVKQNEPTVAQQETGTPSSLDTISVTEKATQLHRLDNQLATEPVVDAQRVDTIRQELKKGTFEVDINRVAEKFFRFEHQRHV